MRFFLVSGYGWTGSSAVVDFLKEYSSCYEPNAEFRLIKDPRGLRDLHNTLTKKWDALNVDIAIRDFIWFIKHLDFKPSKFSLVSGLGYKESFGDIFMKASEQFLRDIIDFEYEGNWWYLDFLKSRKQILFQKIKRQFVPCTNRMYFSAINDDEFILAAQKYINTIFQPILNNNKLDSIILDQAVSAQNCISEMCFVPNSKLIIVDRDPRDIYADLMKDGNLIGKELQKNHDCQKYIAWHTALRRTKEALKKDTRIMFLSFEDLVMHYDDTEKKIESFLGLNHDSHIYRKKYFDPNSSIKNIGMWKNSLSENEIKSIETSLSSDLIQ